jgi:hypothetical protein
MTTMKHLGPPDGISDDERQRADRPAERTS